MINVRFEYDSALSKSKANQKIRKLLSGLIESEFL